MRTSLANFWRSGDGIGIINSALCLVHCIAMPVFLAVGASFVQHPAVSWCFIALAFMAVRSAVRGKKNGRVAIVLGTGWAMFACGMAMEGVYPRLELLTYLGSALLIIGHILNYMDFNPNGLWSWGRSTSPASPSNKQHL